MDNIRHIFPGGNTTVGFFSYFDNILPQDEANHIFCIKGGPGVGKSSLMKKVGYHFLEEGYNIEFHHCSSDPDSLDGVVIKELKIAFIDGTAPHIVDPINPGAVDEVINLGDNWNLEKLKEHKDNIITTNNAISMFFQRTYNYLKSAKEIYTCLEETEKLALDKDIYNEITNQFTDEIFNGKNNFSKLGKIRHLFSYAVSPLGLLSYRDTFLQNIKSKYVINESIGASSEELMENIVNRAISLGYSIECFHSPLKVSKIDDIIIPELNLSISARSKYNKYELEFVKEIDLLPLLNKEVLEENEETINDASETLDLLIEKALFNLKKAKSLHDDLEVFYISSMDFDKTNKYIESIIERVNKFK